MSSINTVDARGLFTKTVVDRYSDSVRPTSFLSSFFREEITGTKEVSIEVERNNELVAVDVYRGAEGNRNQSSRSTEKIIIPPYYHETVDMTDVSGYDNIFGGNATVDQFANGVRSMGNQIVKLQSKIDRAKELQAAQVLTDGIVTLQSDTDLDFKRKAGSQVVLAGGALWDATTGDPLLDLENACKFCRQEGKAQGGVFTAIMGSLAFNALLKNVNFAAKADLRHVKLIDIGMPQRIMDSVGGVFQGRVGAGSYEINIWTYPEFYDLSGTSTSYIDDKDVIVIPQNPRYVMAYGAVPKIMRDTRNAEYPEFIAQQMGRFTIDNYIDPKATSHEFSVKSAPIAIPVAIDTIYTVQVLA